MSFIPNHKKKKSTYQGKFLQAEALNESCKIMWILLDQNLQSHTPCIYGLGITY